MTSLWLILFGSLLCGAVHLAARFWRERGLISVAVLFMVVLPFIAQVPVDFFGLTTNFANVVYAPVIYASVLYARRDQCPWRLVQLVLVACVLSAVVLTYAVQFEGESVGALRKLRHGALGVGAASLVAFVFANAVAFRFRSRLVLAQIAAQAVDSLIFFVLASLLGMNIGEAMLGGFLLKSAIVAVTWALPELVEEKE